VAAPPQTPSGAEGRTEPTALRGDPAAEVPVVTTADPVPAAAKSSVVAKDGTTAVSVPAAAKSSVVAKDGATAGPVASGAKSPVPAKESAADAKPPVVAESARADDVKQPKAPSIVATATSAQPAPAKGQPIATAKLTPPSPKKAAGPAKDVQRGTLKLPSGAATSLAWTLAGAELRLSPELSGGAQVTHAFVLTGPPRAVFDLSGAAPLKSHVVPASPPYATAVRLGKQGAGTRIVVDLDSAPKRVSQDGAALVLAF
jgi:hypothetical protein